MVVLPFVPVTPATSSARVGSPKKTSAAIAIAARASSTTSCGTSSSSGRSTTSATAPAATASAREVVPVSPRAGHAEEDRARCDPPRVVREVGDLDGAAGGALARGEHARQVVEVHRAPFYGGVRRPQAPALLASSVSAALFVSGASGGTSRYWRSNRAMSLNAGAATLPP